MAPLAAPETTGQNLALWVQDWPGFRVTGSVQVPVPPKENPVPVMFEALMVTGAEPVFVMVAVCGALHCPGTTTPRLRDAGDTVSAGVPPSPVSGTWCGDPAALSLRVRFAERLPVAEGMNFRL